MHFLYADPSRNLFHQILAGQLDVAEAGHVVELARKILPRLQPGFDILTDLRELEVLEPGAEDSIKALMDVCNAHRPRQVVRVVTSVTNNYGFTVMSYFHYTHGLPLITCLSLKEAWAHLSLKRQE